MEGKEGKKEWKGEKKERKEGASKQMNPVFWQLSCSLSFLEDPQQWCIDLIYKFCQWAD